MYNIFLTGKVNIGKSTIINEVIRCLPCSVGGYSTEFTMKDNFKHFYITSLLDESKELMAIGDPTIRKVIKIYEDAFNVFGSNLIINSINSKDITILDEIGFIESNCTEFKDSVIKALDSDKTIIGVLKEFDGDFINYIKSRDDIVLFNVTEENRDEIPKSIVQMLSNSW